MKPPNEEGAECCTLIPADEFRAGASDEGCRFCLATFKNSYVAGNAKKAGMFKRHQRKNHQLVIGLHSK